MRYGYSYEKMSNAVRTLAVGLESLQQRIADAYLDSVLHVKRDELPESTLATFDKMDRTMRSGDPIGDEGIINASARNLTDHEASEVAEAILFIADEVERAYNEDCYGRT